MQLSSSSSFAGVLPDGQECVSLGAGQEATADAALLHPGVVATEGVPARVLEKARRCEQLLLRLEGGEPVGSLCQELGLSLGPEAVARLQGHYAAGGRQWETLIDRRYGHPQKANSTIREWLYERKRADRELTAEEVGDELTKRWGVRLSVPQINAVLRPVGLTRSRGRPRRAREEAAGSNAAQGEHEERADQAGVFFLEAAKEGIGVASVVDECLGEAIARAGPSGVGQGLRVLCSERETIWHKLDHLLYLPVLGLERPAGLYHYQGEGLKALYGFTYKYLPVEHFLGELTRLRVGEPLAQALSKCYVQAWYPGQTALTVYLDWHTKPLWTKWRAHSGCIAMSGRVMPGTKQLLVNGSGGRVLYGRDLPIDSHFSHVLGELEAELAQQWERDIALSVFDSEGGGLPTAQRYGERELHYLTILQGEHAHPLSDFEVVGEWQVVEGDAVHEAAEARWKEEGRAAGDPRRLVLMRRVGGTEPTRVYAGLIPSSIAAAAVPGQHRRRWECQEKRIRELNNGANLNENYGYAHEEVPNRTQQRRYEEAEERVRASEERLAGHEEAVRNLEEKVSAQRQAEQAATAALEEEIGAVGKAVEEGQQAGRGVRRLLGRMGRLKQKLAGLGRRFTAGLETLQGKLKQRQEQVTKAQAEVAERCAARDGIDTQTLVRERSLQKDQIMLNLQLLLLSLHQWAQEHLFGGSWQRMELATAIEEIYRKPGRVVWRQGEVEVILDPYRYAEQQQAAEEACRRVNEAGIHWRDGRLIRMRVAAQAEFQ